MQGGFGAPRLLHALDEALDVLHAALGRDHDRVLGLDDDVLVEPHGRHEPVG